MSGVERAVADNVQELAELEVLLQVGEQLRPVHHLAAVQRCKHNILRGLSVVPVSCVPMLTSERCLHGFMCSLS